MSKFFEKTRNLELTSIKENLQLDIYQLQTFSYLRHIKLVLLSHCYFYALILSNFMMKLTHLKVFCVRAATDVSWLGNIFKNLLAPKTIVSTVPEKDMVIALLYLSNFSLQIGRLNVLLVTRFLLHCARCLLLSGCCSVFRTHCLVFCARFLLHFTRCSLFCAHARRLLFCVLCWFHFAHCSFTFALCSLLSTCCLLIFARLLLLFARFP